MAALSAFLPEVMLNAPGCADVVAMNYIRNAAIEFCNLTYVVSEEIDPVTLTAGLFESEVSAPSGTAIVAVHSVYADGEPIDPVSELELRQKYGNWKERTGTPAGYLTSAEGIRIFPIPQSDVVIEASVATRPTVAATTLNDVLLNEWKQAIVSGALSELLMVPGQSFTEPNTAMMHKVKFDDRVIAAQAKAFKQTSYAPLRTVSRP